jgi:hypothetical protein
MPDDKSCKPKQKCKIIKVCKRTVTEMKEMPCKKPPACPKPPPQKGCCGQSREESVYGM